MIIELNSDAQRKIFYNLGWIEGDLNDMKFRYPVVREYVEPLLDKVREIESILRELDLKQTKERDDQFTK